MSGFNTGHTKNYTKEQRINRLERVSSKNFFNVAKLEKNQLQLAKEINSGIPKGTFLSRMKWLLFGTQFDAKKIEVSKNTDLKPKTND